MYHWQFGLGGMVTFGRDWYAFRSLTVKLTELLELGKSRKLLVYVHNLPFEFNWMHQWFRWDKVFCLDYRKPVYANVHGMEFRCSVKLSGGRSLATVGEELQWHDVRKLVGDLNYSLPRHSKTPLAPKELAYCENDVRVLLAYIDEKIEADGDVSKIPLTNTSYVRRLVRSYCKKTKGYEEFMKQLQLTPESYTVLRKAYAGGGTHCSPLYIGLFNGIDDRDLFKSDRPFNRQERRTWVRQVASYDFASSYPAWMLLRTFPMSSPIAIPEEEANSRFYELIENYHCVFCLEFRNGLYPNPQHGQEYPLSSSKCERNPWLDEAEKYNGRVVRAGYVKTWVTELDFKTLDRYYDYDASGLHVSEFMAFEKARLPKPIIMATLDLYVKKTQLKGIPGKELEYMVSKNMLNSIYGMMVTDIVRESYPYDTDFRTPEKPDLAGAIEKYNTDKHRFLFYPWGVYITAWARYNLYLGIEAVGDDYVYSDTDSMKILNKALHDRWIAEWNKSIEFDSQTAADYYGVSVDLFHPVDKKGKPHQIGVWDYEGTYTRFKSLGAKRYIIEGTNRDGEAYYVITVAGANKFLGTCWFCGVDANVVKHQFNRDHFPPCAVPKSLAKKDPFVEFFDGMQIPAGKSGRAVLTYSDGEEIDTILRDYLGFTAEVHERSWVHFENTGYLLGLNEDFRDFVLSMAGDLTGDRVSRDMVV